MRQRSDRPDRFPMALLANLQESQPLHLTGGIALMLTFQGCISNRCQSHLRPPCSPRMTANRLRASVSPGLRIPKCREGPPALALDGLSTFLFAGLKPNTAGPLSPQLTGMSSLEPLASLPAWQMGGANEATDGPKGPERPPAWAGGPAWHAGPRAGTRKNPAMTYFLSPQADIIGARGLTFVFGMGTGVSLSLCSPGIFFMSAVMRMQLRQRKADSNDSEVS